MKLFGLALYMDNWPAFCFGKKAWVCKIIWSSVYHRFKCYHFTSTSENVLWQRVNSYSFKFFGIMIIPKENIHDLDD